MKKLPLLTGIVSLLATTGCLVSEGRRGHEGYRHHGEVAVGPSVLVAPMPEVVARPAVLIGR